MLEEIEILIAKGMKDCECNYVDYNKDQFKEIDASGCVAACSIIHHRF
jgi:hypothetical protein